MEYQCGTCQLQFGSTRALSGHSRVHKAGYANSVARRTEATQLRAEKHMAIVAAAYEANPVLCLCCGQALKFKSAHEDKTKFCSQACSTRTTNLARGGRSAETCAKIAEGVKASHAKKPAKPPKSIRSFNLKVDGPYSKLIHKKCAHCGATTVSRRATKYCDEHKELYGREGRYRFVFSFNPFLLPSIFSSDKLIQLKAQGFWNPKNKEGLTRDHRISVNSAIKHNYDPFYITHPLNCELMPWLENNKKKTSNSLTYAALVKQVDAWQLTQR